MKAEEKENQTNSLLQWFNHMQERLQGRLMYIMVGGFVLLFAVVFGVRYWLLSREAATSARDLEFLQADTEKKLEEIIASENNQGKQTAVWAKLQKARLILYHEGIDRLGSSTPKDRNDAISKVEEGRKRYGDLVPELKDEALQQEAYISLARAEEVLSGVPKEENAAQFRGSIDKAIDYYRKAAAVNPGSDVSKKYTSDADNLKLKKNEIETFYRRLNELGFTAPLSKPDFGTPP